MAKKRVHEIAKERGISSKEALEVLRKAGLDVKVAASSVEEDEAARAFGNGAGASPPAQQAETAPEADVPGRGSPRRRSPGRAWRLSEGPARPGFPAPERAAPGPARHSAAGRRAGP